MLNDLTSWVLEQVGVDASTLTEKQVDAIMAGELGVVHRVEDDGLRTDLMPVVKDAAE